jgi:hypothetical protein
MTDIQRYRAEGMLDAGYQAYAQMEDHPTGDYVLFSDHQSLLYTILHRGAERTVRHDATVAALEAKLAKAVEALHFYADFFEVPNDGPWGSGSTDFGQKAKAALTELEAKV